jgi:hypothetical protein
MKPDKSKEYKYWLIPAKNKFIKPIEIVTNEYGDGYFKYKQNGKEKYFLKRLCTEPYKKILKYILIKSITPTGTFVGQ